MRFIYTKAFAIFAVCLVLVTFLAVLQFKGWLDPVRTAFLKAPKGVSVAVQDVSLPLKNFFTTLFQLREIVNENGQLRSQVMKLQQSLVQYQQEARENQALRSELGFVKAAKQPLAACSVLSENPFGLTDSLILNCGSEDGISPGQAVVSEGYLVGKITYSGRGASTVLLATAADFSTDVLVSQTGANGIVKGSFDSGLILDQVPQNTDLQAGWLVATAGINTQIPKNILVGQVSNILSSGSDLFKRSALISPIDFNNLQFVFVIKQ